MAYARWGPRGEVNPWGDSSSRALRHPAGNQGFGNDACAGASWLGWPGAVDRDGFSTRSPWGPPTTIARGETRGRPQAKQVTPRSPSAYERSSCETWNRAAHGRHSWVEERLTRKRIPRRIFAAFLFLLASLPSLDACLWRDFYAAFPSLPLCFDVGSAFPPLLSFALA